jgi:hypothetical protein
VRAAKLVRRDDTDDMAVRVENLHGRDGLVARAKKS